MEGINEEECINEPLVGIPNPWGLARILPSKARREVRNSAPVLAACHSSMTAGGC